MKTIKFQAYDKLKEELIDWEVVQQDFQEYLNSEQYILLQFTGLIDKNDKEIFHKDVMNYKGSRLVVEWDSDEAMFYMGGVRTDYVLHYGENLGCKYLLQKESV